MNILKKCSIQWELGQIAKLEYEVKDAKTAMQLTQIRQYIYKKYYHYLSGQKLFLLQNKNPSQQTLGHKKQLLLNLLNNIKNQALTK